MTGLSGTATSRGGSGSLRADRGAVDGTHRPACLTPLWTAGATGLFTLTAIEGISRGPSQARLEGAVKMIGRLGYRDAGCSARVVCPDTE